MADPIEKRAAAFSRAVLNALWEGYDLDGGDIQDLARKHKLIRKTSFDPAKHTDAQGVCPDPGDEWFVEAPELRKLARD